MARTTTVRKEQVKMTPELQDEICLAISTSPYMLEELCKEHSHWPTSKHVYACRILDPIFGEQYARAKQAQIEVLVAHIFNLARRTDIYLEDKEGIPFADNAILSNRKMEIDAIKWLAGKLAPKIYGDKKDDKENNTNDFVSANRDAIDNG